MKSVWVKVLNLGCLKHVFWKLIPQVHHFVLLSSFFSLSLNKIVLFSSVKKKKTNKHTHTHTEHIIMFFIYILKYVIWNMVLNIFLHYDYFKQMFSQQFLNHFEQQYLNTTIPNRPIISSSISTSWTIILISFSLVE